MAYPALYATSSIPLIAAEKKLCLISGTITPIRFVLLFFRLWAMESG